MDKQNDTLSCPICNLSMVHISGKYYRCKKCQYMLSLEQPGAGTEVIGIDDVREKNFIYICKILKQNFPEIKTILDVGCSRGLFLEIGTRKGFTVTGIEPDPSLARLAKENGFEVLNGFFPCTKELSDKKYDAIIFNDSMEHIPNLPEIISGIKKHLNKNGVAIVNIPTSDGLIFTISSLLNKIGIHTMYDREWQTGFTSPHVHYFNENNLELLFKNNDFERAYNTRLLYYTTKGLWKRLICKSSFFVSVFSWLVMVILYPLFVLKSDCFVSFFRQTENKRA